jgi:hypothetical protein
MQNNMLDPGTIESMQERGGSLWLNVVQKWMCGFKGQMAAHFIGMFCELEMFFLHSFLEFRIYLMTKTSNHSNLIYGLKFL